MAGVIFYPSVTFEEKSFITLKLGGRHLGRRRQSGKRYKHFTTVI